MIMTKVNQYTIVISIVVLILSCIVTGGTIKQEESDHELPYTISVVLLGRRGAGITSTVRQLLGPKVTIHTAEVAVASTDVLEYTLRLQSATGPTYLKLVDVPGLELVDNLENDAEILSTLKSYLHDKGLPTFFLVVYRFDDKQISQPNSQFRQLLKRVEHFQQALFRTTTDNTVFLLTRLLDEPLEVQKSPNEQVNEFRRVIQEAMSLESPVEIVVGDNKPNESTVQMESGFIKLPNGELYPKNIWEMLLKVSDRSVETDQRDIVKNALKSMIDNRETVEYHTQELVAHATDEDTFESDLEAFEYLIRQTDVRLPQNDIQRIVQASYDKRDAPTQIASCAQLLALQICLRNLQIETIDQLPTTLSGAVKLFQKDMEGVMTSKYSLLYLKQALGLDVPEYPNQKLVVGYGYDLINDQLLRKSPFQRHLPKRPSSSLGYQFPDFMECEKLPTAVEVILGNTTETNEEYHQERLKQLTLPDRQDVVISQLQGHSKSYLNFKPSESRKLVAGKEIRLLECKMSVDNDSLAVLDESFVSFVNSLVPLNTTDTKSVQVWKLFLRQYGTHVVVKGYGGGCYQGTLFLQEEDKLNTLNTEETLGKIVDFGDLTKGDAKTLIYEFHDGGDRDVRASHINLLTEADKAEILETWKSGLSYDFEMLTTELELVPLSQVVAVINAEKGSETVNATKLLLKGNLETNLDQSTHVEITDAGAEKLARLAKAKNQAESLKLANHDKTKFKLEQLNAFLDSTNAVESS